MKIIKINSQIANTLDDFIIASKNLKQELDIIQSLRKTKQDANDRYNLNQRIKSMQFDLNCNLRFLESVKDNLLDKKNPYHNEINFLVQST
jgi:hypothetical protein